MSLALIFSIFFAAINFLSGKFTIKNFKFQSKVVSLAAGISVTYIFLHLLPVLYESTVNNTRTLFIFVLAGFVVFHIIERFIYKFVGSGSLSEDLKLNHSLWLLVYDFSIGVVLVKFFSVGFFEGFLFFIPVFVHSGLSSLSIHKIHGFVFKRKQELKNDTIKVLLSAGSVYGTIIALIYGFNDKVSGILTALVAGILLYVVIRETIPKEKEGDPIWFVVGVISYSLLIFWTWIV